MSKVVTIRNVPEDVVDELAGRAARSGRSLQEYLRGQLCDLAAKPDLEVWLDRVGHRVHATGTSLTAEQIVTARDADRP